MMLSSRAGALVRLHCRRGVVTLASLPTAAGSHGMALPVSAAQQHEKHLYYRRRHFSTYQDETSIHQKRFKSTALAEDTSWNQAPSQSFQIPHRVKHKSTSAEDAVALIHDGDTVSVSGFVCQGCAEAVLAALGKRYEATGHPNQLTLLFGGGPGDWGDRGLSHMAKMKDDGTPPMLRRTIGSHYGQTPGLERMALDEVTEAWTLPMGSISRMLRAQSTHSPYHITNVGVGTYVDPDINGGAANENAKKSPLHSKLVQKVELNGETQLLYKALPVNVAIIRGTTADAAGNITVEQESLLCDQRNVAAAAKNSGGIVIAQVKRLAAVGSLPQRTVAVPGALVDCVVVIDQEHHDTLHPMSYVEDRNPAFTGELVTPVDELQAMDMSVRKLIARRAFFNLRPDAIVNLGIGLPEGVAAVAAEEDLLQYVTLTTEPGVFGGLPASGHSFGPARNPTAQVELNQMFDFYDGGGLDMCFLGAAQISEKGDVNVSRMSPNRLTGPGGFVDISQSTRQICFLSPFTAKGLEVNVTEGASPALEIEQEGSVKKFVKSVYETTFSGDEAVRRGQSVLYVTERAVFRRTAKQDVLELIEIAPGVDLERDILQQMEFEPVISPDLKTMDSRIFQHAKMNVLSEIFGSLDERCSYHSESHTMYLDLFGVTLASQDDVDWFFNGLRDILRPLVEDKGKIDMVVNYNGFDVQKGLEDRYKAHVDAIDKDLYRSIKRFTGAAFTRQQLGSSLKMQDWDPEALYDEFRTNGSPRLTLEELRTGMSTKFNLSMTLKQLHQFREAADSPYCVDKDTFAEAIEEFLNTNT